LGLAETERKLSDTKSKSSSRIESIDLVALENETIEEDEFDVPEFLK
jgi:hypothetical protein